MAPPTRKVTPLTSPGITPVLRTLPVASSPSPSPSPLPLSQPHARDTRIDVLRGFALLSIFCSHSPAPGKWFAYSHWGLSGAAELFIFLFGYSLTLSARRNAPTMGWRAMALVVGRKVFQLYRAHVVTLMAVVAIGSYFALRADAVWAKLRLEGFHADPIGTIQSVFTLQFQPYGNDILPTYGMLMLLYPLVRGPMARHPLPILIGSFLLYCAAPFLGPVARSVSPGLFNPFAWQFMFLLGAYYAVRSSVTMPQPSLGPAEAPASFRLRGLPTPLLAACVAVAAFGLVMMVARPWLNLPMALQPLVDWAEWVRTTPWLTGKFDLAPLRLLHFVGIVALFWHFVWLRRVPFDRWPGASVLSAMGRHSLAVFCFGIMLSAMLWGMHAAWEFGKPATAVAVVVGVVAQVLLAQVLERMRLAGKPAGR